MTDAYRKPAPTDRLAQLARRDELARGLGGVRSRALSAEVVALENALVDAERLPAGELEALLRRAASTLEASRAASMQRMHRWRQAGALLAGTGTLVGVVALGVAQQGPSPDPRAASRRCPAGYVCDLRPYQVAAEPLPAHQCDHGSAPPATKSAAATRHRPRR